MKVRRVNPVRALADRTLYYGGETLFRCAQPAPDGTRRIVEGKDVGVPFHDGPEGLVVYFDIGGMVYDPERLGVEGKA